MSEPAQQLPEHHGPESSTTGVTGVSGVHTRRLRSLGARASSIPPALLAAARPPLRRVGAPLQRLGDIPPALLAAARPSIERVRARLQHVSDFHWVVFMALLAPLVGFATYLALDTLTDVPSPLAKLEPPKAERAFREALNPGMEIDLGAELPPPVAAPPEPTETKSAAEYLGLADNLRTQGHHGRARHNYALALRLDHDNRWAMVGMIRSLLSEGKIQRALDWSRRLRRESPRWTTSHLMQGNVLARQGDLRGARASWSRALELSSRNAEARRRLEETENPY